MTDAGSALGHDYTKQVETEAYLKTAASNCREYNVYWYACSRCDVSAKDDAAATDKYYTVKEGSTIVTLKPEYLNTLTAGKRTLEIVWTDGTADTTFTVDAKPANTDTKSPQTGDSSSIALWIALLFVSAAGVLSTAVLGKKKKRSAK